MHDAQTSGTCVVCPLEPFPWLEVNSREPGAPMNEPKDPDHRSNVFLACEDLFDQLYKMAD